MPASLLALLLSGGAEGPATFLGLPYPFWQTLNFLGFIALLVWLLRKPLVQFFENRRLDVAETLRKAEEDRDRAQAVAREVGERLVKIEAEIEAMRRPRAGAGRGGGEGDRGPRRGGDRAGRRADPRRARRQGAVGAKRADGLRRGPRGRARAGARREERDARRREATRRRGREEPRRRRPMKAAGSASRGPTSTPSSRSPARPTPSRRSSRPSTRSPARSRAPRSSATFLTNPGVGRKEKRGLVDSLAEPRRRPSSRRGSSGRSWTGAAS